MFTPDFEEEWQKSIRYVTIHFQAYCRRGVASLRYKNHAESTAHGLMCKQKPYTRYGFHATENSYPVLWYKHSLRKGVSLNIPSNTVNFWIIKKRSHSYSFTSLKLPS